MGTFPAVSDDDGYHLGTKYSILMSSLLHAAVVALRQEHLYS
jgi:hypothetical protein